MSARPAVPDTAGEIVGHSELRIFGLSSSERLRRQLSKAGARASADAAGRIVLLRADWVYDDAIVHGLVRSTAPAALAAPDGQCIALAVPAARGPELAPLLRAGRLPAEVPVATPATIGTIYNDALRKREPPYLLPLTNESLHAIEACVFKGSYKGVTDIVTARVWPRPARAVTRWCANRGVTPNIVTTASLVLVLAAMGLFWLGHYVPGLVAAWAMTFLDTVDGKLARVTLQSSRLGNVYDHSIDLIHPPFWWWAWIVGLPAAGHSLESASLVLAVILAGYILQRLEEGLFIAFFKMDMHVWRRFDSRFRLVTARRNPNLIILTASVLIGRPDWGIAAVAVWVAICLAVHAVRLAQAALARRGGPLRSWLA